MDDQIYIKTRALLVANPELGKKKLAILLGVHAPMSRRLKERYKGEIAGHRTGPEYQRFLAVKTQHQDWGYQRIVAALHSPIERAKLCLARYAGVVAANPPAATKASGSEAPAEFWAAVEDLLAKASGCKPEKILFVAGNDFFNTDTGLSWCRLCEPVAYASFKRAAVLHALVNPSWL